MNIKKHFPNILTLGNLFCGTLAAIYAINLDFETTFILVVLGIIFDFFDGFVARMLKVSGGLGKQLDSLADVVTSGVVPGIVMYNLLNINFLATTNLDAVLNFDAIKYLGLFLTLGAGYRLAKFNIDTRQSESFIGLPTPAMSLFIVSLPIVMSTPETPFITEILRNNYVLIAITVVLTYLLNAEITLLSLKFKTFSMKENWIKYVLLIGSLALIITLKFVSISLIIVFYVLLSIINNYGKKASV